MRITLSWKSAYLTSESPHTLFLFNFTAETRDNVVSIKMKDLKRESIGEYSCEMKYFDLLESVTKTIISAPIRLTSQYHYFILN